MANNPDLYLAHIEECLAKVQAYTREGRAAFMADTKRAAHIQAIRDELARQNRIPPPGHRLFDVPFLICDWAPSISGIMMSIKTGLMTGVLAKAWQLHRVVVLPPHIVHGSNTFSLHGQSFHHHSENAVSELPRYPAYRRQVFLEQTNQALAGLRHDDRGFNFGVRVKSVKKALK